ncbi:MAG: oligosaccharide flippase family protein [Lachnospiraceae bacterium]|nr:oligosaccharide flippase family protein [Lachnospiraceae bacterium]
MSEDNVNKKALKAGVWYTASSFLQKGIGFISTPIFARILTKTEFGSYSNFAVWFSICAVVCTLDLKASVARAKFDFEDDFDGYISSITFFGTVTTAVFYAVVILFMDFFVNLLSIDAIFLHVMFIELLVAPSLDNIQAKHRIQQKYKVQVAISVFLSVASTFFAVLGAYYCKDKLFGRIMGAEITNTFIYVIVFIYVMYKGRRIIDFNAWKYAAAYSVPIIPHLLSNIILGSSDKAMITKMVGKEANGVYSLAYSGGLIVSTLMTCFNQAMVPWLFEKLHAEDTGTIKQVNRYYILGFSIIVTGSILFAPELIWILGGEKYAEAAYIVPPIMLGYGFKFAYTNYVNLEQYEKKTGIISIGTLIAAGFNVGANLIFIPVYGFKAAAYTTLAGFVLLFLIHYFISRKYGFTRVYDNRYTFVVLFIMTALGLSLQMIYPFTVVRWIVIAVAAAAFFAAMAVMFKKYGFRLKG